jgi:hypothetical protein
MHATPSASADPEVPSVLRLGLAPLVRGRLPHIGDLLDSILEGVHSVRQAEIAA